MPILIWVIFGVVVFNVLFVAVRVWATREPIAPRHAQARLAPMYVTIPTRHHSHRTNHRRGRVV